MSVCVNDIVFGLSCTFSVVERIAHLCTSISTRILTCLFIEYYFNITYLSVNVLLRSSSRFWRIFTNYYICAERTNNANWLGGWHRGGDVLRMFACAPLRCETYGREGEIGWRLSRHDGVNANRSACMYSTHYMICPCSARRSCARNCVNKDVLRTHSQFIRPTTTFWRPHNGSHWTTMHIAIGNAIHQLPENHVRFDDSQQSEQPPQYVFDQIATRLQNNGCSVWQRFVFSSTHKNGIRFFKLDGNCFKSICE